MARRNDPQAAQSGPPGRSQLRTPARGQPDTGSGARSEPLRPPPSIFAGLQESGLFGPRGGERGQAAAPEPPSDDAQYENPVSLRSVIEDPSIEQRIEQNRRAVGLVGKPVGTGEPAARAAPPASRAPAAPVSPAAAQRTHAAPAAAPEPMPVTGAPNNSRGASAPRAQEGSNMPGTILRRAREALGLSQRDIALRLKLRINTISDIEHDRLSQPTAAPFARGHLTRYAKLVNIDPNVILELYNMSVDKVRERNSLDLPAAGARPRDNSRYLLFAALGIVLLGVVFYVNTESTPESEDLAPAQLASTLQSAPETASRQSPAVQPAEDKPQVRPAPASPQPSRAESAARPAAAPAAAPAVEPVMARSRPAALPPAPSPASSATITIDTQAAKRNMRSQEDTNTRMAREQASALGTNDLESQVRGRSAVPAAATAPVELSVSQSAAPAAEPAAEPAATAAVAVSPAVLQSPPVPAPAPAASAPVTHQTTPETDVSLAKKLRDISSGVSITAKSGLASMNEVNVRISGTVALRITDSRNKVLRAGRFKAGDTIRVQGIPPIRVAASDTSRIRISYMGGQVRMPSQKQVSFVLPTR